LCVVFGCCIPSLNTINGIRVFSRDVCTIYEERKNGEKCLTGYPNDKDANNCADPSFEREQISRRKYFSKRFLRQKENSTVDVKKED
jgi:hypothetical protein